MTTEYATAPESAKLLKAALRKAFPATMFSVRLSRGTGYGYCYVNWTDGPTMQRVDAICGAFEGSTFDGMTDMARPTYALLPDGRRTGLRGILTQRTMSASLARLCVAQIAAYYGVEPITISDSGATWRAECDGMYHSMIERTGQDWNTLIYQAASDRSRFTFSQESI